MITYGVQLTFEMIPMIIELLYGYDIPKDKKIPLLIPFFVAFVMGILIYFKYAFFYKTGEYKEEKNKLS